MSADRAWTAQQHGEGEHAFCGPECGSPDVAPQPPAVRLRAAAEAARYTADLPDPLREPLATWLETEARVDTEDRAALEAEEHDPARGHASCTTASCTTEAALALADALLAVAP